MTLEENRDSHRSQNADLHHFLPKQKFLSLSIFGTSFAFVKSGGISNYRFTAFFGERPKNNRRVRLTRAPLAVLGFHALLGGV